MHDLIAQGKVLYWGTSEWSAQQIQEAYGLARQYGLTPPTMEQPQYNMLARDRVEREYHRLYAEIGLGTTIWSPLASGILTGKYKDGIPEGSRMSLPDYQWLRERIESPEARPTCARRPSFEGLARRLGVPLARLAIAWCLKNPNVSTVILGASKRRTATPEPREPGAWSRNSTGEVMEEIEGMLGNRPRAAAAVVTFRPGPAAPSRTRSARSVRRSCDARCPCRSCAPHLATAGSPAEST